MSAPQPQGCGRCGVAEREHMQRWKKPLSGDGWHKWERPSDAQVLARMKARRLARFVAREGVLPVPVGPGPLKPEAGACKSCGDVPSRWCPDCGACKAGCYGGHDDNPCSHANASWGGV